MTLRPVQALTVGAGVTSVLIFGTGASADSAPIENALSKFRERYGFPGAIAAIALPNGEIVTEASGLADIEAHRRMASNTPNAETPRRPVHGHRGSIPGYVSSLRHDADHGVTVAFQINTDFGIADDSTVGVPVLEAALADFALEIVPGGGDQ